MPFIKLYYKNGDGPIYINIQQIVSIEQIPGEVFNSKTIVSLSNGNCIYTVQCRDEILRLIKEAENV